MPQIVTPEALPEQQSLPRAVVVDLPPDLQAIERAITINAEIIRQNIDYTVLVQAAQGKITVQLEPAVAQALTLEPGQAVQIRLEAGAPPQAVSFRILNTPEQPLALSVQNDSNAALPLRLSLKQLLQSPLLEVRPFDAARLPQLVQPFTQIISSTVTPIFQPSFEGGDDVLPKLEPQLSIPVYSDQGASDDEARVILPRPAPFELPLRAIAAQIIKSPLEFPISNSDIPDYARPPLSSLTITALHETGTYSPLLHDVRHGALVSDIRAGESRALLIGFSAERLFPVFQILSPSSVAEPLYFALQSPEAPLAVGSEISFDLKSPPPAPLVETLTGLPSFIPSRPEIWQSLSEIQDVLLEVSPQASQVFAASVPNVSSPGQISNAVLFFLVALRSGDVQGWIGERGVEALRRAGKSDLLSRITGEFTSISRANSEGSSGDWRLLSLPLMWQNEIHKAGVYYRKEDNAGEDARGRGSKTRFVMNLNLSAIGPLQLDALFVGGAGAATGRLDLIVRTHGIFTEQARQEMRALYHAALHETQITGELSFQGTPEGWVKISADGAREFREDI